MCDGGRICRWLCDDDVIRNREWMAFLFSALITIAINNASNYGCSTYARYIISINVYVCLMAWRSQLQQQLVVVCWFTSAILFLPIPFSLTLSLSLWCLAVFKMVLASMQNHCVRLPNEDSLYWAITSQTLAHSHKHMQWTTFHTVSFCHCHEK